MFILARTIKTLIHGALIDRPKLLKNGELEQEIMGSPRIAVKPPQI
jgi:hypothetical protein